MRVGIAIAAIVAATSLAACGGGDGDGSDLGGDEAAPSATGAAARGEQVADDKGCTSCHTTDGSARAGPTWDGIWGTEVELDGGDTAVVDRAYLVRAMREPDAEVVAGFTPIMPTVPLTDDEVDELVAYIESLG